jgi:hypothetical protein
MMTKIESARIIEKRNGDCRGIKCVDCFRVNFCDNEGIETGERTKRQTADAIAYIKRHEGKSRRCGKIPTPNFDAVCAEGEMPKVDPIKYIDPTPLDVAKAIKNNKYKYNCTYIRTGCSHCKAVLFCIDRGKCSKDKVDSYIAEHNKSKPIIEPIKFSDNVPAYVYMVTDKAIKREKVIAFLQRKTESAIVERIVFDYGGEHSFENCYKTLDEAVAVAKKQWSVK